MLTIVVIVLQWNGFISRFDCNRCEITLGDVRARRDKVPYSLYLLSLIHISLVLMIGSFLLLAQFSGAPPGSTYVPAHVEDGKFVPGATR